MSIRRRWGLNFGLVAVVAVVAGLLFSQQIRNAPLPTSDTVQTDVTVEAESGGSVPLNVPGRDLAVMTNREGNWDIALIAADGTVSVLTDDETAAQDYFPSWAMDGNQISFVSTRLDANTLGPTQINADGTGLESLTVVSAIFSLAQSGRFDWDPAWSPDGTQMVWSSIRDLNLELYLIDTAKDFKISNAVRMTNSGARDWFGAWSPDGKSLVRSSDVSGTENIYRLTIATGQEHLLAAGNWDETRPVFSLDGKTVLFASDQSETMVNGEMTFSTVAASGGAPAVLGDKPFEGAPVWTPDSSQIAYMSNESGRWQIYVMNADGSNKRRVTPDDGDYVYPVWRP